MKMKLYKLLSKSLTGLALLLMLTATVSADLLVIVHPDNPNKIDAKFVKNLYLGKETRFDNGDTAVPLILEEGNPLTELFLKEVIRQKPVQFKRLWSKALFTGKGTPPEVIESEEDVLRLVMSNPSMIGFIDSDQYTNDVRAVLRLKTK
jgi:ABC-type phosphate transport system substrate-binding protein